MKHLGDITKLNGAEVPIVDVICGGSPCQDLSVAGKRAGLAGERSGLFMEQIRIIKEMREHDRRVRRSDVNSRLLRPRYMVWENVPGALSSPGKRNGEDHRGEDFQAVLTEIVRIVKADAPDVPLPKDRRWPNAGGLMGIGEDGQPFSIAYRVHDAQFWGVAQRRKRIALVADFGGLTAPEILFERESVSGDSAESGEQRQGVAATSERDPVKAISFQERAGCAGGGKGILIQKEHTGALSTLNNQSVCYGIGSYDSNSMRSANPHSGIYEADTSRTLDLNGGNPACNQGGMAVVSIDEKMGQTYIGEEVGNTLSARDYKQPQAVVCGEGGGRADHSK